MKPVISIIMGSDSDLPVMSGCAETLDSFKVEYELTIVSAHRTPKRLYDFAMSAEERGIKVIIAAAGGSAHLPGMTAAITPLPVIGVPILTKSLGGLDSLYSIVQMPPGIPVATVAINGAVNAALLALKILASSDAALMEKLKSYSSELMLSVTEKAQELEAKGYEKYLENKKI